MSQTTRIDHALSQLTANHIVFLDLDNCVLTTPEPVARDEYWSYLLAKYLKQDMPLSDAQNKANEIFNAMQYLAPHTVVDPDFNIADHIAALQKAGVIVLGLTARGKSVVDITLSQLKKVGVGFSEALTCAEFEVNGRTVVIKAGVIFCNEQSKGECLASSEVYLEQPLCDYEHVRFIDDKISNLKEVSSFLSSVHDNHKVIHYTYMEKCSPFGAKHLESAKRQHEYFLENKELLPYKVLDLTIACN